MPFVFGEACVIAALCSSHVDLSAWARYPISSRGWAAEEDVPPTLLTTHRRCYPQLRSKRLEEEDRDPTDHVLSAGCESLHTYIICQTVRKWFGKWGSKLLNKAYYCDIATIFFIDILGLFSQNDNQILC